MASERSASLSGLPSEVVWCIADALDSLADVASLGATCMDLWHVCIGVIQRRMHVLETGARESMDAFVDEWQRFATDYDDEAKGDCDPCLSHPDGFSGHDSNADDDDDDSGGDDDDGDDDENCKAHEFGIFDGGASPPSDMADSDAGGSNVKRAIDPRLRFCGSYRLFDVGGQPLDPCTGALDWSLHVNSYECRRFVCDACARALASALDDDHHIKWPMSRVRMDQPHVWAGEWCGVCADVYVPTPPVESCRVPVGLGAWIDPDAARCLAEDICRARSLFDADCGPLEKDDGGHAWGDGHEDDVDHIRQTNVTIEDRSGDMADGNERNNRDDADGNNPDAEYYEEVEEHWRNFYDNSDNESNNDDVLAARARRRRKDSEADNCDDPSYEDSDNNNDNDNGESSGGDSDHVNGKKRGVAKDADTPTVVSFSNASSDQNGSGGSDNNNEADHVIVFGDESDGAPRQDPFKCIFGEDRFGDWPRYDHDNPAPAALVRIYHAPVLLMGNLRAWLPVGMSRQARTRPYGADVSRYVLVCCDPASPLWGAAMAVRVFTDRWPCIMWLPGADDARAAIEAYRRRSQKTPMGLREGFVHWLCTARRVPSPMEWEKRRAAAIAARRPVVPLWTGFPRFSH
nr:hypothetical protein [Pandoravirus aubagnensis]